MTHQVHSPEAYKVHQISSEQIKGYPFFVDIQSAVDNLLTGRQVGIYNAEFDIRIMRQSATLPKASKTKTDVSGRVTVHS